ncbi:MAG: hypothetical protein H0S81_07590, partial [Desulfotignum balticum]|nr:hypothetical protein [Desulfotignum balticum]
MDILNELGKIGSAKQALAVFEKQMDTAQLGRISSISHPEILKRIANAVVICNPDKIFINTGS